MKKLLLTPVFSLALLVFAVSGVSANYDGTSVDPVVDGDTETYSVVAEEGDTVTLDNVGSTDGELEVTFANGASGSIVVNELSAIPSEVADAPPGEVGFYFDVDLVGITNDDITSAVWQFSVPVSTIEASGATTENVFLYHYDESDDTWERLTTRFVSSDGTNATFEADVTSFSPFAVSMVLGLSNTGSQQVTAIIVGLSTVALVLGTFFFTRKSEA